MSSLVPTSAKPDGLWRSEGQRPRSLAGQRPFEQDRTRIDLLATRIGMPPARRAMSAAFASKASRSTSARTGVQSDGGGVETSSAADRVSVIRGHDGADAAGVSGANGGRYLVGTVQHEDVGPVEFGEFCLRAEGWKLLTLIGDRALLPSPDPRTESAH